MVDGGFRRRALWRSSMGFCCICIYHSTCGSASWIWGLLISTMHDGFATPKSGLLSGFQFHPSFLLEPPQVKYNLTFFHKSRAVRVQIQPSVFENFAWGLTIVFLVRFPLPPFPIFLPFFSFWDEFYSLELVVYPRLVSDPQTSCHSLCWDCKHALSGRPCCQLPIFYI